MRSLAPTDLSSLARAALSAGPDLRALALRVGAQSFAAAPTRDRDATLRFEALAIGLIPLVPSDVLAGVAQVLRHVPDAPPAVLRLLSERLDLSEEAHDDALARATARGAPGLQAQDLITLGRDDIDLALARNAAAVLDARALHELVDRARLRPALARALLARGDLALADRAHLYWRADPASRERIRQGLAVAWFGGSRPRPVADPLLAERLGRAAELGDPCEFRTTLCGGLGIPDDGSPSPDEPVEAEFLALALRAAGLSPDETLTALLMLRTPFARSVGAMFDLATTVRSTPAAVAARLVGVPEAAERRAAPSERAGDRARHPADVRPGARLSPRPAPRARGEGSIARAGHRSRSTTGPDRT